MGFLSGTSVYLCGQIETDKECGEWRKEIAKLLNNKNIKVWDPLIKPHWMSRNSQNTGDVLDTAKIFDSTNRSLNGFNANIEIRNICKTLVNRCDFMIARLINKFTWGSIDELEIAINRKIPIFFWLPDGPLGVYGIPAYLENKSLMDRYVHYNLFNMMSEINSIDRYESNLPTIDCIRWIGHNWPNACNIK